MHKKYAYRYLYCTKSNGYNSVFMIGTPNFGCHGYLCDNRTRCLSYSSVCNGYTSCADKSDEGYCCKA